MERIYVEPKKVGFLMPCLGGDESVLSIRIQNPTSNPITFKVRLTRPDRFRVKPIYGFVEPKSSADVRITPNAFDHIKKTNKPTDRFTVLVAPAPIPHGEHRPKDIWAGRNTGLRPQEPHRIVVNILYVNPGEILPPRIENIVKEESVKEESVKEESVKEDSVEEKSVSIKLDENEEEEDEDENEGEE